ncbi:hypothetical protein [Shewanella sp. UCD-KL12]|uniref:hypothetical protein n=1 Tax=Shewanella sp. UCD-KL12 TaxID=1917163 RepID=UPI0015C35D4B|nr:hypothetical protein [Shewanella sp. UCD-KL12]
MKTKIIAMLTTLGFGLGLMAAVNANPMQDEQRYCAENPRDCYCEYRPGGAKVCFIL